MSVALKKRIAPSVLLKLDLNDDLGSKFTRTFRLSFDANAAAEIEERTGLSMLSGEAWQKPSFKVMSIMFWAAVLANHPEYDTEDEKGNRSDEGLRVIRSYMDVGNALEISDALEKAYMLSLPPDRRAEIEKSVKAKSSSPQPGAVENPPTTPEATAGQAG